MIITSRGYMRTRDLEVILAVAMLVSGVVFMMPGETLANPVFARMTEVLHNWLTEEQGGFLLIIAAGARFHALWRNSHLRSSPIIRLAGCAVGAAFWMAAFVSVATVTFSRGSLPWILGILAVLVGAEIYSAVRTGFDADALDSYGFRRRALEKRESERRKGLNLEAGQVIEWQHAVPLITVILTVFGSIFGLIWAAKNREKAAAEQGASGVPGAIAGAIAERGTADALTYSIAGLTSVIVGYIEREEKWRNEDDDVDRKRHREVMDELRRMTQAIEDQGRR